MHVHLEFEACLNVHRGWYNVNRALFQTARAELEDLGANNVVFFLIIRIPFVVGIKHNLICLLFVYEPSELVSSREFVRPGYEHSAMNTAWFNDNITWILCPPGFSLFRGHSL